MSTRRDDELDLLDNLSEGLVFYLEAASVSVDAEHMRRVIEIARRAVDAPAPMPDLTATAFEQVGETRRGYALFRTPNCVGGHTYCTRNLAGGVMVWDTCLVSAETLRLALSIEAPETEIDADEADDETSCEACGRRIRPGDPAHNGADGVYLCFECAPTYADLLASSDHFQTPDDETVSRGAAQSAVDAHIAGGGELNDKIVTTF